MLILGHPPIFWGRKNSDSIKEEAQLVSDMSEHVDKLLKRIEVLEAIVGEEKMREKYKE